MELGVVWLVLGLDMDLEGLGAGFERPVVTGVGGFLLARVPGELNT